MRVSVLLPSRGRMCRLLAALDSLYERATEPMQVETLIKLDWEDDHSVERIAALNRWDNVRVLVDGSQGYERFHEWVNDLARLAKGTWLFLFNDDCTMETTGWDTLLDQYDPSALRLLRPHDNTSADGTYNCFPLVPAWVPRYLGHVSLNPACDSWLIDTVGTFGQTDVPITIAHARPGALGFEHIPPDETYLEGRTVCEVNCVEYHSPSYRALREKDIEALRAYPHH